MVIRFRLCGFGFFLRHCEKLNAAKSDFRAKAQRPTKGAKVKTGHYQVLKKSAKKIPRPRPKLPRVSEEMKRIAALLETEVLAWGGVTARPMFGMTGLYRDRSIFAALPRTRALDAPDSIAFRFPRRSPRMNSQLREDNRIVEPAPGAKWISFLIHSEEDIHGALNWLSVAYREAGKKH